MLTTLDECLAKIDADIAAASDPSLLAPHRERLAAVLRQIDPWPDTPVMEGNCYAGEEWEIDILWYNQFGSVELSTEPEGGIGYFVKRGDPSELGRRRTDRMLRDGDLSWVMSFLNEEEPLAQ